MTSEAAGPFEVTRTEAEWKATLTPSQFAVLRRHDTEFAGTSPLLGEHRKGTFLCAGCGQALFSSGAKYESGSGWPSFWAALDNAVATTVDRSLATVRTEIHCSRCGGHLGHVFPDGPRPTGLRYLYQRSRSDVHPCRVRTPTGAGRDPMASRGCRPRLTKRAVGL